MSLKQKTISGILWSAIGNFSSFGIQFIIGIILARLLTPREFGLIGMITVFIAISDTFINGGFSNALIRKKDCTQADYSTVFFFNMAVGFFLFVLLFICAPAISNFFKEPSLKSIVRVLALNLIINSLTIIQGTILTKRVDFKLKTRISVISSTISGVVAIFLAMKGLGVWSLVVMILARHALNSLLLWLWNGWRPELIFSKTSFTELFSFGSKLLASSLIDTIYKNVYYLIIGKYFSAPDLGFYTRANSFTSFPSENITKIMSGVTYPVLSQMQNNPTLLKQGYRRMIKSTMFVTFILMLGMAAVAEPMVISLIGEKWRASIIYMQLLCLASMLYPLHALNLNILNVQGRSDLFLILEIIKKVLAVPIIIIGVFFGIKIMIVGMILNSFISYYLNSYWSGKLIDYGIKEQLKDIIPSFLLASAMAITVFTIGYFLKTPFIITLSLQIIAGTIIVFSICELMKLNDYLYLKQIVIDKVFRRK